MNFGHERTWGRVSCHWPRSPGLYSFWRWAGRGPGGQPAAEGRAAQLAAPSTKSAEDKIRELYLSLYAREPLVEDLQIAMTHLKKVENQQEAFEDIVWALINTKEFLFNH